MHAINVYSYFIYLALEYEIYLFFSNKTFYKHFVINNAPVTVGLSQDSLTTFSTLGCQESLSCLRM